MSIHTLREALWLGAALAITLLFTAWTMTPAFSIDAIQDDARQHLFWMLRFRDPSLFPDDLIADYYEALAPPGYAALYRALSVAIDPLLAGKLLPPLLGLVSALFCFLAVRRLYPAPAAAFLATVLLSRYAWQHAALASGTPRSFLLPLLAAFLWTLASGRLVLAVGIVGLSALLYPVGAAIGVGVLGLRLVGLRGWRPLLGRSRADWLAFAAAALLSTALLLPGQLATARFGPVVSAAQARAMPEFREDGHNVFFVDNWYTYWIKANRSGLDTSVLDARVRAIPIFYEHAALAASLPLLLLLRRRWPSVALLNARTTLLVQLLVASFGLFFLAHLVLFRLYLPGRYVKWSLPLVLSVAGGIGLAMLCLELARRFGRGRVSALAGTLALALGVAFVAYPGRWQGRFVADPNPAISAYLRQQPADTLVAAAPSEADWVPSFAARRVLVSREYALAYHLGYYDQVRRRMLDLIEAYYAESPREVLDFASRYGVDVMLVNRLAFDRAKVTDAWGSDFEPYTSLVRSKLEGRGRFALLEVARRCDAVDEGPVVAVPVRCLGRS